MASVIIGTNPITDIDYSIVDGRVRSFDLCGEILYDEDKGINIAGWEGKLIEIVIDYGMNIDKGLGLKAFVYKMIDEGLIPKSTLRTT